MSYSWTVTPPSTKRFACHPHSDWDGALILRDIVFIFQTMTATKRRRLVEGFDIL